jgi:peptidylprolyl isomerase
MRFVLLLLSITAFAQTKLPANIPAAEGKIVTQYTMRYIDVAIGDGKLAEAGKVYVAHYTGWLYDGTQFDSSRGKDPLSFEQGKRKVIPGWDAGFEGMRVGGKRRLLIPYQLAYGEKGRGKIPPKADLIFDIELMDVKDAPPPDPAAK